MKRIMSIIAMLMISVAMFAQSTTDSAVKQTAGDQITQVVNTLFDKTTEAVNKMAEALKIPAKHVYNILVKQQVIQSTYILIIFLLCLSLGVFLIVFSEKSYDRACLKDNKQRYGTEVDKYRIKPIDMEDDWWLTGAIIGVVITAITFVAGVCLAGTMFTGFLNPEYGAIKDIMDLIN